MALTPPIIVFVAAHWESMRRGTVGATYCRDRHCMRFPDAWSAVRISLENARAAGFAPCRKCWNGTKETGGGQE